MKYISFIFYAVQCCSQDFVKAWGAQKNFRSPIFSAAQFFPQPNFFRSPIFFPTAKIFLGCTNFFPANIFSSPSIIFLPPPPPHTSVSPAHRRGEGPGLQGPARNAAYLGLAHLTSCIIVLQQRGIRKKYWQEPMLEWKKNIIFCSSRLVFSDSEVAESDTVAAPANCSSIFSRWFFFKAVIIDIEIVLPPSSYWLRVL